MADAAIMRTVGAENVATLITSGLTGAKIAELLGVPAHAVAAYLHNLDDEQRALIATARKASAEQIIDEAGDIVDAPGVLIGVDDEGNEKRRPPTSAEVSLRKLQADHRYRRAAQRNSAYREKAPVDPDGGPATNAPPVFNFTLTVLQQTGEAKPIINVEPDAAD